MARSRVKIYAVILAGGKGKRLRPLSTDAKPKAFLSVTKDRKTMFKKTVERISRIIPSKNILVVANKRHSGIVKRDFRGIDKNNLILEPVSRNTGPAIALAASILRRRSSGSIMVVLPADHYIPDEERFLGCVKAAVRFVKQRGDVLVTLGVKPASPATEFGYIKVRGKKIFKV